MSHSFFAMQSLTICETCRCCSNIIQCHRAFFLVWRVAFDFFFIFSPQKQVMQKMIMVSQVSKRIRQLKQTVTATLTRTSPNKRFNKQNNGYARGL